MKFVLKVVAVLFGLGALYGIYTVWDVWNSSHKDQPVESDAIVVLGAAQYNGKPSPVLKARLDHAAALYKRGIAPTIVVTGGKTSGDDDTEASASAEYLGTLGVPDKNVLREVQGRSSWQSLQAAALFMKARDIHKVVLVSDPFHNARINEMGEDLGLESYVSPTKTSPIDGSEVLPYYVKESVALGFGRVFGFSRLAGLEQDFSA